MNTEPVRADRVAERSTMVDLEFSERVAADAFDVALRRQFPRERTGDTRYHMDRWNARTRLAAQEWQAACDAYMAEYRARLERPL